jgi:hypothetical protein
MKWIGSGRTDRNRLSYIEQAEQLKLTFGVQAAPTKAHAKHSPFNCLQYAMHEINLGCILCLRDRRSGTQILRGDR